ncbi:hypothetical protein [Phycicoccus sonneratiae]|uniref:Aminoglycoside phosphotransferase domain-containing protein n=1 Tax=Phycicoccus sonneratiae TaxID=2807628 RepID=A0ABS2CQB8_9MICO|nr:hypothetical protein [Phycicoccus sonneraticus]MBM6402080.1 hypothetical protein [Phycicoccus sonneraticus]
MTGRGPQPPTAAGPRAERPGLGYVRDVMALMHPGAEVTVRRRPRRGHARAWSLVPGSADPRLLVPSRPRAAAVATVSGLGGSGARGAAGSLLGLAARAGGLALLPHLVVEGDGPALAGLVEEVLGRPVALAMSVGRVRALQKPVLRVLGHDGSTLAYVKVGVDDTTRGLVDHEAEVLHVLAGSGLRRLVVPEVLAHRPWHGLSVLVQAPVGGPGGVTPAMVSRAALELSDIGPRQQGVVGSDGAWRDLVDRVAALAPSTSATALVAALDEVGSRAAGTPVEWGPWHGDFASWNMAAAGDRLAVWDWEGFAAPVPVGLDLLHHRLQDAVVVEGRHPRAAVRELAEQAPALLGPWGPADPTLVVLLYVVLLAVGFLETGDHRTRLSRLDEWLEPALAELVAGVRR